MRISTALKALAALALGMLVGCTSSNPNKQSFWQNFSFNKKSPPATSSLANAPAAPSFQTSPTAAPTVVPGSPQTAGNLAMQPGTNYPVTQYPDNSMPRSASATSSYANNGYAPGTPTAPPTTATYTPAASGPGGFGGGQTYTPAYSSAGGQPQAPSSAYDYNAANPSGTIAR